jgi:hypothetical protein
MALNSQASGMLRNKTIILMTEKIASYVVELVTKMPLFSVHHVCGFS